MFSGIVNVYKEPGFTSHDVVAKLRGIYGQKKVGHTGTLDPMAEGVLIVVLGQATKLSDLILTSRKQYTATMQLGITTETDDTTGEKVEYCNPEKLEALVADEEEFKKKLVEVFGKFLGKSMQVPPMYSAIKINGKKLYEYARAGIEIHPEPRPVEIFELELVDVDTTWTVLGGTAAGPLVRFKVDCSKGTYVRALIRDIGRELGVGAAMSGLLRDEINGIYASDGYRIDDLQRMKDEGRLDETVLPIDKMLESVPAVRVKESGLKLLTNGNRLGIRDVEMISNASDAGTLKSTEFFRVYIGDELKALYTFDKDKKDYKVFKML